MYSRYLPLDDTYFSFWKYDFLCLLLSHVVFCFLMYDLVCCCSFTFPRLQISRILPILLSYSIFKFLSEIDTIFLDKEENMSMPYFRTEKYHFFEIKRTKIFILVPKSTVAYTSGIDPQLKVESLGMSVVKRTAASPTCFFISSRNHSLYSILHAL